MNTLTLTELIGCSLLGALLPDVIRIIKNKDNVDIPEFLKHPNFWLSLSLLIIISIVANLLASPKTVQEAIAFAYGAPEFLSKILSGKTSDGSGGPPSSPASARAKANIALLDSLKEKRLKATGDIKIDIDKYDLDFLTLKDSDVKAASLPSIREWWGS